MTYHQPENTYVLSTGRRFYAHGGVIGIGPHPVEETVSEGWDGGIEIVRTWDEAFVPWTGEERAELADEMIRRWTAFKT